MHVQAATYDVLTHKSFPSLGKWFGHFPFFMEKMVKAPDNISLIYKNREI